MYSLVLVGGGGHAASLFEILPEDAAVAGYVDICDVDGMTLPRLGDDLSFIENAPDDSRVMITYVAGRSCSLAARSRLIRMYEKFRSPVVAASTAYVAKNGIIGDGTAIFHKAVVNSRTRIGRHCIINTGAIVEHDCVLGENVFIGPGAVVCGGCQIGDNVYIGANATIRQATNICSDTVIGLGAAVVGNINNPGTYAGVPACKIK